MNFSTTRKRPFCLRAANRYKLFIPFSRSSNIKSRLIAETHLSKFLIILDEKVTRSKPFSTNCNFVILCSLNNDLRTPGTPRFFRSLIAVLTTLSQVAPKLFVLQSGTRWSTIKMLFVTAPSSGRETLFPGRQWNWSDSLAGPRPRSKWYLNWSSIRDRWCENIWGLKRGAESRLCPSFLRRFY